uniref:Uncharacterized protein n=1 Tax=Parascaris univalens TaxID=6257 RepID=A0A915C5J9_PARUN
KSLEGLLDTTDVRGKSDIVEDQRIWSTGAPLSTDVEIQRVRFAVELVSPTGTERSSTGSEESSSTTAPSLKSSTKSYRVSSEDNEEFPVEQDSATNLEPNSTESEQNSFLTVSNFKFSLKSDAVSGAGNVEPSVVQFPFQVEPPSRDELNSIENEEANFGAVLNSKSQTTYEVSDNTNETTTMQPLTEEVLQSDEEKMAVLVEKIGGNITEYNITAEV